MLNNKISDMFLTYVNISIYNVVNILKYQKFLVHLIYWCSFGYYST